MNRSSQRTVLVACLAAALPGVASAGGFIIGTNGPPPVDRIMHVRGYPTSPNPVGANYSITVCLDPNNTPLNAEQSVRNAVAEYNRMQGQNSNVTAGPGGGQVDFESMLLHELGHCMGLDHNTLGPTETGDSNMFFFTNAQPGPNAVLNGNAGVDTVRASRDDVRLDDVNKHWFRVGSNNPFTALPAVIDQTTWSISTLNLPVGHTFAEAATSFNPCAPQNAANTSLLRGVNGSMAAMMPVLCSNNSVRRLQFDDVATLRIARAGYNGTQGNTDDYTWTMSYVGRTTACNIPISLVGVGTGFAQCNVQFQIGQAGDGVLSGSTAIIALNSVNWFYNQVDTTGGIGQIFRNGFE
jgi:hypothetical protein